MLPLDRPIALHAARLAAAGRHASRVFGEDPAVFDAGAPWWRAGRGKEDEEDLDRALELLLALQKGGAEEEKEGEEAEERRGEGEEDGEAVFV